ncbi:MAG: hypothetical protein HY833_00180 [Candidatus Aenigmarchaeota archaeon]|nr:hypothetical protein [Candidatus Aenigmarchaeota archaeon]
MAGTAAATKASGVLQKVLIIVAFSAIVGLATYYYLAYSEELFYWTAEDLTGETGNTVGQPAEETSGQQGDSQQGLTTAISPARDLTGDWAGTLSRSFSINEETEDVLCLYTGTVRLTLRQQGNGVIGSMRIDKITVKDTQKQAPIDEYGLPAVVIPCGVPVSPPYLDIDLEGTASSSTIDLQGFFTRFSGSFTADLMTLYPEQCVFGSGSGCSVVAGSDSIVKLAKTS